MSKINDIVANIVSTIQGINGAPTYTNTIANAYSNDKRQVEAGERHFGEIPIDQFPHFSVVIKNELRNKEPQFFRRESLIEIIGKFRDMNQVNVASWLADVEIALSQDIRRGSLTGVIDSWIEEVQWDDGVFREGDAEQTFRIVKIQFHVVDCFQFGQP